MKVTLVQMDIAWGDAAANRETAERLMLSAERSDLYVLPEMWNTGVTTEPRGVAEPEGGDTLQWMQRMANKLDAAVCGSIAVETLSSSPLRGECQYRNRLYFVMPAPFSDPSPGEEGSCQPREQSLPLRREVWRGACYDKHHLFSYGGETEHYTPGAGRVNVEWRGVRFRLCVCYDLRFPLWLRCRDDYDALICVASWPQVRMQAWEVLLQARAIENQCYVLGVNRVGRDPVCEYSGGSCIVNPFGFAESCPEGGEAVLTRTLDLRRLKSFRDKFPVLKEQDWD